MTGPARSSAGLDPRQPIGSFASSTRGVLLEPARFFADLRGEVSYAGPVLYALACQLLAVLLAGLYDFGRAAATGDLAGVSVVGTEGAAGALLWVLWLLGLAPLYAFATLFVGAAVYQLLVLICVGRRNAGYGATLRVTAYLSSISLLVWMPVVGLLAGPWGVWINAVGIRELHQTTTNRALLVAAIPYALSVSWSAFWVLSGQSTFGEYLFGGGTMFPTRDDPL